MKIGMQEPDWKYIGACLAQSDDNHQIEFFKAFVWEAKTYGTNYQTEAQMLSIAKGLTQEEKETLSAISYVGEQK